MGLNFVKVLGDNISPSRTYFEAANIYTCLDGRHSSELWYFPYCMQHNTDYVHSKTGQNFAERIILVRY